MLQRSCAGTASSVWAGERVRARYDRGYPPHVVAESRFGNGTVVGAVRPSRSGFQVQMPGGTWIDCRRSCSDTLRVETVDFWQNPKGAGQNGAIDNECGFFGCLTWERRF